MESPSEPLDTAWRRLLVGSVLTALLCAFALLVTSPGLPMVWDEGDAILRAEKIPGQWPYTTQREGHPALYGMVIAAGRRLSAGWLEPLSAARFGPMVLFGLAAGAMFYRIGRDYSGAAAAAAVAALMLMPRVFAHAHFASLDGPLTSCWILAWATFPADGGGESARCSWRWTVLWGIALGTALSCKATGWIAPLPFLAWAAVYRDRVAARTLAVGLPVAVLTFFALNPPLWHDPLHGWAEFFHLNLHRAPRLNLNIPVQFLGESHHLGNPLPWYNALLWTAVTVPVGTLLLAAAGATVVLRRCRTDRAGVLLLANWLVLLIVRGLPMVPPHDGVRLFLPSFAFLAALAGVGAGEVFTWAGGQLWRRCLAAVALVLIYAGSASSLLWYAPQWLSYYNLPIGGLPGATAAGMEPTYYWDGLDRPVLNWLHKNTREDQAILFQSALLDNLRLMQQWGVLRRTVAFEAADQRGGPIWYVLDYHPRRVEIRDAMPGFRWYVMQHRTGLWPWQPIDRWLVENAEPACIKTIRPAAFRGVLRSRGLDVPRPWRLDVPLVEVYGYEDYLRARKAIAGRDIRPGDSP